MRHPSLRFSVGLVVLLLWSLVPKAIAQESSPDAGITDAVEGFHRALAHGDRVAAVALLATDAVILESGESQTRAEYEREHLGEDIAFGRTTKTERSALTVHHEGNTAWTTATSKTTGTFDGREVNSTGVELMVLTKDARGWIIRAIHWSNQRR